MSEDRQVAPNYDQDVADQSFVAVDLPCIRCDYNLRTQPLTGRCPECDSPVETSLYRGLLCFADHAWIDQLQTSATTVLSGAVTIIGTVLLLALATLLPGSNDGLGIFIAPMAFCAFGGLIVAWFGALGITGPEPHTNGPHKALSLRSITQSLIGGFPVLCMFLIAVAAMARTSQSGLLGTIAAAVGIGLFVLVIIASAIGPVLFFVYIAHLARRAPASRLVRLSRECACLAAVPAILGVVLTFFSQPWFAMVLLVLFGLACLALVVAGLVVLVWLRRMLTLELARRQTKATSVVRRHDE